ncbi:hypothetical protein Peur_005155 [Populus x canadensis]
MPKLYSSSNLDFRFSPLVSCRNCFKFSTPTYSAFEKQLFPYSPIFFISSHLFFNYASVNAWPVFSLKQFITYFQPALSRCVFGRIPFSIALIQMSQNVFNISLVQ